MADQTFNVHCGFFDSVNRDRLYTAEEMNRPYKRIITNGVFATPQGTPSTDLATISAESAMNIIVKRGEGIFGDKWFENPSDIAITVPSNTNIVPRRDSVVIQIDKRSNGRTGNIVYRTGTPSSNPQVPDIGTVTDVIEYRLANIYVAAGATAINADAIVDLRGSSECPWVTSLVKQPDTSALWENYRAAFEALYNEFRAEGQSLLTIVGAYDSSYTTVNQDETVIPIQISQYRSTLDILEVRVNGLVLIPAIEYTILNNTQIELTLPVDGGTVVAFRVYKSIDTSDAETVAAQVVELQNDVNALEADTGWTTLILGSGIESFDATTTPKVRKTGNTVHIRGAIKAVGWSGYTITTLPEGYRPSQNVQFTTSAFADGMIADTFVIEVRTSGVVSIIACNETATSAKMLPINTSFVLG